MHLFEPYWKRVKHGAQIFGTAMTVAGTAAAAGPLDNSGRGMLNPIGANADNDICARLA